MLINNEIKSILKSHKLSVTSVRVEVLDFFIHEARTLSFRDLENKFKDFDRVTLYRTLNSFTERGVLHKIPDDSGFATYGLCHDTCDSEDHKHDHMHFKCNDCGTIECLELNIPSIQVPGYKVTEADLILKGTCNNCVI
jgi:Fur family ferric uptake transcriptional regulator